MNRQIMRLAVPNIISNLSIPLLSLVDIAIAGRLGGDSVIGGLAIGTSIFNFIYWIFSFIRMGASGLTAQAYGAENKQECADILTRALCIALFCGLSILTLNKPVGRLFINIMQGSESASALALEYFYARVWAVPAGIAIFAIQGWFIGMQDSKTPMVVAIISNMLNPVFCCLMAFTFDMGIAGIGYGTVMAQYCGLLIYIVLWLRRYGMFRKFLRIKECFSLKPMIRFLHVNKDIFIRTTCIVVVYTYFTAASARFGDTVLATNTILMELFMTFSYLIDGFGYAAESLVGRFIGARDKSSLTKSIRLLLLWSFLGALLYAMAYVGFWRDIMRLFSASSSVLVCAGEYIWWIVFITLFCFVPFLIDGILVGATKTKILRNSVFFSSFVFFGIFLALSQCMGNNALWLAFAIYVISRGIYLLVATKNLNGDYLMDVNRN